MFTTNEEDQKEAARLQARLRDAEDDESRVADTGYRIPNVTIADGAHKYVLISALVPGGAERQHFVVSKRNAAYHRNAAEPMVDMLEGSGYSSISVTGGGRINLDEANKTISIFGYSYGFGQADHELSKSVVERSEKYSNYEITTSTEGY